MFPLQSRSSAGYLKRQNNSKKIKMTIPKQTNARLKNYSGSSVSPPKSQACFQLVITTEESSPEKCVFLYQNLVCNKDSDIN